ncbi:putative Alpha/Beta hydrolase protein [Blattamonas nauphoetae]|uniref:Alpha/Beta hydrolase protein n=1 Tax=Blattamonas nauphoetae TaxID=2049346 RepID=A0ABQ9YJD3_9EUKA|nr:putative Alpha/Beta hydrolase protein [Blattamonas nauphoetae]
MSSQLDLSIPPKRHEKKIGKQKEYSAQIQKHFSLNGVCQSSDQNVELYYEVYGTGSQKVILIDGLASQLDDYQFMVLHLVTTYDCSVCVFQNRHLKWSTGKMGRFTTSLGAADTLAIVDKLGWEKVIVGGMSMGGMITLEFATRYPERCSRLYLGCTTAGFFPSCRVICDMLKSLTMSDPVALAKLNGDLFFTKEFLDSDFAAYGVKGSEFILLPPEQLYSQEEVCPSNVSFLHMLACVTHRVSDARLKTLKESGMKIVIVHGTEDVMIPYKSSVRLAELTGGKLFTLEGEGHVYNVSDIEGTNRTLDELMRD